MTIWQYIGCKTSDLPEEIHNDAKSLTSDQLKNIIKSIPLVEGKIEAYDVNSVVSLLMDDGIVPIKIHPHVHKDNKIDKLRKINELARNQIIKNK